MNLIIRRDVRVAVVAIMCSRLHPHWFKWVVSSYFYSNVKQ